MDKYLPILKEAIPTISIADLDTPIRDTDIDSLGLVVVRVAIEKHFGFEISDEEWYRFKTLGQALIHFHNQKDIHVKTSIQSKQIKLQRTCEVGMPQMANNALSENWLIKEFGDLHWSLISQGLEQKSSKFQDDLGNRLYATFIRICYSLSALNLYKENNVLNFNAKIKAFGNDIFLSFIKGKSDEDNNEIEATLMTIFSTRVNNDNSQIVKGIPSTRMSHLQKIENTPAFLNEYRLLKKGLLEEIPSIHGDFRNAKTGLFNCFYEINPYYEINGVGLLYFASYPIIADKCLLEYFKHYKSLIDYCGSYFTIFRDIFYFANCNPNDILSLQLNSLTEKDDKINSLVSLYRQSDNKLLAKILTVKQRIKN